MKKLFIFDFDGTLFDSIDDVMINFNEVLKKHNFPTLTREEYINRVGGNIDEIVSAILGDEYNSKENIEMIKKAYESSYDEENCSYTKPFKGIREVLLKLMENNVLLAINSNRKTDSVKNFTDSYFNDIDFTIIEGHNPDCPSKPNPCGVNKIIRKTKVDLNEIVYIGDSIKDIQTAENAGIDCVLVSWGYSRKDDLNNDYPIRIISNPEELLEII